MIPYFVKVASRSVAAEVIRSFMTGVVAESSVIAEVSEFPSDNGVKVYVTKQADCQAIIDVILESYETLGMEITDPELDIYELVVFCNDPEVQAYYTQMRMNFDATQIDAVDEMISDLHNRFLNHTQKLDRIDTMCELNGIYKMRKILTCISSELETKGIFVGDSINNLVTETVH